MSEENIEKKKFKQSPNSIKIPVTMSKATVEEVRKLSFLGSSDSEKIRSIVMIYLNGQVKK